MDFFLKIWSWRNPMLHCCHFSNIQFQEAISRASDKFVVASHSELRGLRQGWRIITVAGKEVQCPQEAVEFCSNVRGRIWVRTLNPRSRYGKAPQDFRNTLEASDHTIRRAPCNPPCATRDHRNVQQQLTLLHKTLSGASGDGAQQKRRPSLLAPAGGSSSKVPWQIFRNPGSQATKLSLL